MEASLHGTVVDIAGLGVLLRGPSGIGKSDLALRLLEPCAAAPARLVADDRVMVKKEHGRLIASPPPPLYGLLEVRGLGLIRLEARKSIPLGLIVDLVAHCKIERMPDFAQSRVLLEGVELPLLKIHGFDASAPARLRIAVKLLHKYEPCLPSFQNPEK